MTKNLAYSAVASGSAVLMLLLLTLAGRWLGVDDYGAFTFAITIATIAEVFMDFGLHQVTIRAVARDPSSAARFLRTSLVLKLLPGVGMIVIVGAAVFWLRDEPDVRLACLLMLGGAAMRSLLLTAKGILQGLERFGADALLTTADRLLLLIACGLALLNGAGVVMTSLVFLAVRVVTAAASLWFVTRLVGPGTVDRGLRRRLPLEALPIGAFLLVLNVYNRVDTVMLGSMSGDRETGLYGAAYPLYEGLTYAASILSAVLVPRLSRLWADDTTHYGRLARRALGWSAVMAVVLAALALPLAEWTIVLAFGAEYREAASTFRILLVALPFIYVLWGLHSVALSCHHTRALVLVTAIGTVVNVLLNAAWIPTYGADGAAAATVISEGLAAAMLGWSLRHALAGRNDTGSQAPAISPADQDDVAALGRADLASARRRADRHAD